MKVIEIGVEKLKAYEKNPRKNDNAVKAVANSIKEFGFKVPIVISENFEIVCGHTRVKAAQSLGIKKVPCVIADDLTDSQLKAFRLADNKTAELSEWDFDLLVDELQGLNDVDMKQFGFEIPKLETNDDGEKGVEYEETFQIIIPCDDEKDMESIYKRLTEEGIKCRVSTL